MGQDSEAAAEFVATVRGDHAKMKEWYSSAPQAAPLRSRYGDYPALWKEVLNWPGWKEARKEYLRHSQQNESNNDNNGGGESVPRKRKSRWGSKTESTSDGGNQNNNNHGGRSHHNNDSLGPPPEKRAAVGAPPPAVAPPLNLPGMQLGSTNYLSPQQQEELSRLQAQLRRVNDRLDNLEREAARVDALPRDHRDRSPSPPPIYGADGKRKNTRAVRWRERYTAERQDLLEAIMKLRGGGRQSSQLLVRKRIKKIPIPIEKHPTYNFIGLIIGPRGKTQKELEAKTGCKIAIRGRGSVKEGARGRRDGKVMEGDNEPLHVVISGDNQGSVDAAADMISQMLVVIDDEKNVHKQQQLRELALLNGTLKDDEFCEICAEKGHRSFACPKRFSMRKPTAAIKCAICGDTSHPTSDCTRKGGTITVESKELDSEYQSFMAELDGKKPEAAKAAPAASPTNGGSGNNNSGPPPPPANLPQAPAATGLPPPPPGHLPPPPPPAGLAPPPLGNNRPPPPTLGHNNNNSYYGHQGPQQGQPPGFGGRDQRYGGPPQQQYPGYGQQPPPPVQGGPPQQPGQPQVRPGDETAAWDPSSYYNSYGGGAGGFNWWDK